MLFLGTERPLRALLQLSVHTNEMIILKDRKLFEDRDDLFHLCTSFLFLADGDIL